jgi:hypothetical protein
MHRFEGETIVKRTAALALTIAAFASGAFADGLSKQYKKWDRTPEAYFLTNAERAEWKKVKTDQEAQNFILELQGQTGPEFEKMLREDRRRGQVFSAGETMAPRRCAERSSSSLTAVMIDAGKAKVKSNEGGDANVSFAAQSGRGERSPGQRRQGPAHHATRTRKARSRSPTTSRRRRRRPKAFGSSSK